MNDNNTITKIINGDYKAYKKLKQKHLHVLERLSFKIIGNRQLAIDTAQEGFNYVIDNIHLFDESKSFFSWVYTIVKNKSIDIIKKRGKLINNDIVYFGGKDFISNETNIDEDLINNEDKKQLYYSILTLTPCERIVTELFFFFNMEYKDIALCINKNVDCIGVNLLNAKKNLKKWLK